MTQNQIAYWNLQETKRSNLINEQIKSDTQKEQVRSNLAKELETNRSNLAKERETHRSNLVNEMLNQSKINSENTRREVQNVADSIKAGAEVAKSAVTLAGLFI